MYWSLAFLKFSGKYTPNMVDPLHWVFLNHWEPRKQQLVLRYVPENSSSSREVTGKWQ